MMTWICGGARSRIRLFRFEISEISRFLVLSVERTYVVYYVYILISTKALRVGARRLLRRRWRAMGAFAVALFVVLVAPRPSDSGAGDASKASTIHDFWALAAWG